jgi:hypothetical protein
MATKEKKGNVRNARNLTSGVQTSGHIPLQKEQ